jgi:diacylglycerol kinase (ATP)
MLTFLENRIRASQNAFRGIWRFFAMGIHAKIQLVAACSVFITALLIGFSLLEWVAVTICISLVLALEAINTALEQLADELSTERRPRIRDAKDIAAAAVLIAAMGSTVVFAFILCNHLSL